MSVSFPDIRQQMLEMYREKTIREINRTDEKQVDYDSDSGKRIVLELRKEKIEEELHRIRLEKAFPSENAVTGNIIDLYI